MDNSDAERRRIKALKALKERLKKPDDDDVKTSWNEKLNFSEQNEPHTTADTSPLLAINDNHTILLSNEEEVANSQQNASSAVINMANNDASDETK
jgi:hypothetical protein